MIVPQFAGRAELSILACGESETTHPPVPADPSVASRPASSSSDPGDGFCHCGCGGRTPIPSQNRKRLGHVKGVPTKFIHGHNMRTQEMRQVSAVRAVRMTRFGPEHPQWRGDDATYRSLHTYLQRTYPKVGACEWCGEVRATDWANISGNYTRDRADYAELCRPCHGRFDKRRARDARSCSECAR